MKIKQVPLGSEIYQTPAEAAEEDELNYQVKNFEESMSSPERERQEEERDEGEEPECDECEKLKQLVFQAKEAIDDLKAEIDEWREISASKDAELRTI